MSLTQPNEIKQETPVPHGQGSNKQDYKSGIADASAHPSEVERDDDRAANWANGQHSGLEDNSTEQEPPPIGIKEDG